MEFLDVVQNTLILSSVPASTLHRITNDLVRWSSVMSCNLQNYFVVECNLSLKPSYSTYEDVLFSVLCCL